MKTFYEIQKEVERESKLEERNVYICMGIIIAGCLILSIIPFM